MYRSIESPAIISILGNAAKDGAKQGAKKAISSFFTDPTKQATLHDLIASKIGSRVDTNLLIAELRLATQQAVTDSIGEQTHQDEIRRAVFKATPKAIESGIKACFRREEAGTIAITAGLADTVDTIVTKAMSSAKAARLANVEAKVDAGALARQSVVIKEATEALDQATRHLKRALPDDDEDHHDDLPPAMDNDSVDQCASPDGESEDGSYASSGDDDDDDEIPGTLGGT